VIGLLAEAGGGLAGGLGGAHVLGVVLDASDKQRQPSGVHRTLKRENNRPVRVEDEAVSAVA
jgi:hypothetical protein